MMIIKPSAALRVTKAANTALAPNFKPGQHDVVCSRGRRAYSLVGNRNFRQIIDQHLETYTHSQTRAEKSMTIIAIVDIVRRRSPHGGFIRFCKKTKSYVEIGDKQARDKVGHAFREAISSSTKDTAGSWQSACQNGGVPSSSKDVSTSSTDDEKNEKWFCDKPLPVVSSGQRMSLLATFAAEFNFDQVEEESSSCDGWTEMDAAELRSITAEVGFDDDQSLFEDLEDLLGSV